MDQAYKLAGTWYHCLSSKMIEDKREIRRRERCGLALSHIFKYSSVRSI